VRQPASPFFWVLTALWVAGLVASGVAPYDRATWVLEVFPVVIAWPVLHVTKESFRLTGLAYALTALHGLILMLGAAYTYARVPFGFMLQEFFAFDRNPYDKIGHFAQGFVPAIIARELMIRLFRMNSPRLVAFLSICVCMAISSAYELIEWGVAVAIGMDATAFLGTQGDPWDTQSDMAFALLGAIVAQPLGPWHDRQIAGLATRN
jgi:putative membrane protein